jgi:hypothetical protein
MNSETRSYILDIINDLYECPLGHSTFIIQNWLYGAFDGYDYSAVAIESTELQTVKEVDSELGEKILKAFNTIEKYKRTNEPNSNQF